MRHLKFLCTCVILLLTSVAVFAQTQITGHVADMKGEAIIGANVTLKGTTNGTITDFDGHFTLNVNDPNGILAVSFIGYKTKEVKIGEKTIFQIILEEDTETLDEVVVVGYGTQTKKSLTGAVSDVKSDALTRSVSTTTAGALSGKIAGISTRAVDARPGRGINLEIRNMGSPLFVIDGIPYGGMNSRDWLQASDVSGNDVFNALNIEDIESITVLKDASAAIYGLRAANGVVLVTTKKGRKNEKVSINVNGYYGWQNLTRFPKLANAGQYVRGLAEAAQNRGEDPNNLYTPEELAKWQAGTEPGYKSYDYYDMVMRKNVPQYHINANVTGGSDKTNYYLSVAHTSQDAMMRDFKYQRTNFQLNLDSKITDHFTVGAQISGKYEKSEDVGLPGGDGYYTAILAMFKMQPIESPYANDNPEYINNVHENGYNPAAFRRDIAGYKDNLTRNANINAYAQYDFKFGLTAKATFSYNYTNSRFDGYQYAYQIYTYDKANDTYNGTPATGRWRSQIDRSVPARYMQLQLNYTKQFKKHNISAVLGYEASDYDWSKKTYGTEPSTDYLPLLQFDELNSFGDEWSYEARAGWIGRINYNFAHKYLIEILARYDGSYLYAPSKRWGFFPGVSAGWNMHRENFFKPLESIMSRWKWRASWGRTGNNNLSVANSRGEYKITDTNYQGSVGILNTTLKNSQLRWETTESYDIGVDLGFFNNRLGLLIDYYNKLTFDRLYDEPLWNSTGFSSIKSNYGSVRNSGIEIELNATPIQTKDFSWDLSLTFAYNKGIVVDLPDNGEEKNRVGGNFIYDPATGGTKKVGGIAEGEKFGGRWAFHYLGTYQTEEEAAKAPNDPNAQGRKKHAGDAIFEDVNNDGQLDSKDMKFMGYIRPDKVGGIVNSFKYKGLTVRVVMDWAMGHVIDNGFKGQIMGSSRNNNNAIKDAMTNSWQSANDGTKYPKYTVQSDYDYQYRNHMRWDNQIGSSESGSTNNSLYFSKGDYLAFREVSLSYMLPSTWVRKIRLSGVEVFAGAYNIGYIKKYDGMFPEIYTGVDYGVYPRPRQYNMGVKINF